MTCSCSASTNGRTARCSAARARKRGQRRSDAGFGMPRWCAPAADRPLKRSPGLPSAGDGGAVGRGRRRGHAHRARARRGGRRRRAPVAAARARVLLPLYALAAVVLTWPLGRHLATRLTTGTEPTDTVPLFNLWTLRWNQQRIGHLWAGYWTAAAVPPHARHVRPVRAPAPHRAGVRPRRLADRQPGAGHERGRAGDAGAERVGGGPPGAAPGRGAGPAALAGLLAVGLPFVVSQAGVLQLTAVFPLLLVVDALVRWAGGGGRRAAASVGLWLAVTFLTCGYYGLFAVLGIGLPALVLVRRDRLSRDGLVEAGYALAAFLPAVPFLVGQEVVTADYARSEETIRQLSAWPSDHLLLREGAAGVGVLPWVGGSDAGIALYPGTALLVLAVGGAWVAWSERRVARRVVAFLVAGAVGTRVLSLGLELSVLGVEPYRLVRAVVPGYADLRSPNRAAALSEVFLVALAAFGLDALWRWRPRSRPGAAGPRRAWGRGRCSPAHSSSPTWRRAGSRPSTPSSSTGRRRTGRPGSRTARRRRAGTGPGTTGRCSPSCPSRRTAAWSRTPARPAGCCRSSAPASPP